VKLTYNRGAHNSTYIISTRKTELILRCMKLITKNVIELILRFMKLITKNVSLSTEKLSLIKKINHKYNTYIKSMI
jgi:hypothetical protein